ncbi:hypothetical protein, partial [Micromonospora sagamiensis]|uniref:hypothetical protein n=1 Tax=Micromonospora sagamiensis TaxID=47875 RepID=UPI0035EAF8FB
MAATRPCPSPRCRRYRSKTLEDTAEVCPTGGNRSRACRTKLTTGRSPRPEHCCADRSGSKVARVDAYREITYAVADRIATISLNRPEERNGYT